MCQFLLQNLIRTCFFFLQYSQNFIKLLFMISIASLRFFFILSVSIKYFCVVPVTFQIYRNENPTHAVILYPHVEHKRIRFQQTISDPFCFYLCLRKRERQVTRSHAEHKLERSTFQSYKLKKATLFIAETPFFFINMIQLC